MTRLALLALLLTASGCHFYAACCDHMSVLGEYCSSGTPFSSWASELATEWQMEGDNGRCWVRDVSEDRASAQKTVAATSQEKAK